MTELIKKTGVVSKVRHKIVDGEHTASFYLDKVQVYMTHHAPIPVENGDSIAVAGWRNVSGLFRSVALKNPERERLIPSRNTTSGSSANIMFAIAFLVVACAILLSNFILIVFALLPIRIGLWIKKSGSKHNAAIELLSNS